MAKFFYVYSENGNNDIYMVKMYNGAKCVTKEISAEKVDGFRSGLSVSDFIESRELAEADVAESNAREVLEEKQAEYYAARSAYETAAAKLKKVKEQLGLI